MLLLGVLVLTLALRGLNSCPARECLCHRRGIIKCTDINLRKIPAFQDKPSDETEYDELDLSRNRIRTIGKQTFKPLKLRVIKVIRNKNRLYLHGRVFKGLEDSLEVVDFKKSHIQNIPSRLFAHMNTLINIDLSYNEISEFPRKVFLKASSVKILSLTGNRIKTLDRNVFWGLTSLETLNFAENRLEEIHSQTFKSLGNLEELDMSYNDIRNLQPQTFRPLRKLQKLNLAYNHISAIFGLIFHTSLPALQWLSIAHNELLLVDDGALESLVQLQTLDLSNGRLSHLSDGALRGLRSLKTLSLQKNSIMHLSNQVLSPASNLEMIQLDGNRLNTVNPCALANLTKLYALTLNDNPIECYCSLSWAVRRFKLIGTCTEPKPLLWQDIALKEHYAVCNNPSPACLQH